MKVSKRRFQRRGADPQVQEPDQANDGRDEQRQVREQHQSLVKVRTPAQSDSAACEQREGRKDRERFCEEAGRGRAGREVVTAQTGGGDRGRNSERHDQGSHRRADHSDPAMPQRSVPDDERRLGEEQSHPGEHDKAMHLYQHSELARVHEIPVLEAERPEHEEGQDQGCPQEVAMLTRTGRHAVLTGGLL